MLCETLDKIIYFFVKLLLQITVFKLAKRDLDFNFPCLSKRRNVEDVCLGENVEVEEDVRTLENIFMKYFVYGFL